MNLAVVFLLSFAVLITQQQRFPYHSRGLLPVIQRDYQFNEVDLYSYLLARRLMQSAYPVLPQLDAYSHQSSFHVPQPGVDQQKLLDIESRVNSFGRDSMFNQVHPRFFANYATTAGSSYFNPFLKTVYLFTSSVITTTEVTTCIPGTYFVAASSTVACRKRRGVLEALKHIHFPDDFEIAPSSVEHIKVQPTADPASGLSQVDLFSSIEEKDIEDSDDAGSPRSKRFFGGLFYSTTTLTSYVLSTVSSTKTLTTLAATSALSCRPSGYVVC